MKSYILISLLAFISLAVAVAIPVPQTTPTTTTTSSSASTNTNTTTTPCTATAVSPPPATATCGIYGGTSTSAFPLTGYTGIKVTDIAECAQQCLDYSDSLCESFGVNTFNGQMKCILFAYTVEELAIVPQDPAYGPGTEFFDEACYALSC